MTFHFHHGLIFMTNYLSCCISTVGDTVDSRETRLLSYFSRIRFSTIFYSNAFKRPNSQLIRDSNFCQWCLKWTSVQMSEEVKRSAMLLPCALLRAEEVYMVTGLDSLCPQKIISSSFLILVQQQ